MRNLYKVDDNGATFWVMAEDELGAIKLVLEQEDRDDFEDAPFVEKKCSALDPDRFLLDGEEESCSMWFAYLIARDYGAGILACSEW